MRKKVLIGLISILAVSAASLGIGLTYAGFAATDKASQTVYRDGGEMKRSIFLDCEEKWNLGYNEMFFMRVWNSSNALDYVDLQPTKTVTLTLTGNSATNGTRKIHVFLFDTTIHNKIRFARVNPAIPYANISNVFYNNEQYIWGKSPDITYGYSSTNNFFHIRDYVTDSTVSKYRTATINTSSVISSYSNSDISS